MHAFYFVIDEGLADITSAHAYHMAKSWGCDVHIFIEKRDRNASIREVSFGGKIHYHYDKLMQFLPKNLPSSHKWPLIVYLRLFAPQFLTKYVRLLYLDADVLSLQVEQQVWTLPLPYGIGAVTDFGSLETPPPPFDQYTRSDWLKHIGVSTPRYLNSGVLLIDVARWLQFDFSQALQKYFEQYPHAGCFDQDFLSSFLNGEWTDIGARFNYQAALLNSGLSGIINPVFVHFSQPEKPWYGWLESGVTNLDPYFGKIYSDLLMQINVDPSSCKRTDTTKFAKKIKTKLRKVLSKFGLQTKKEKAAFTKNKHERKIYLKNMHAENHIYNNTNIDEIYFDGRNIRSKFTFPSNVKIT